VLSPTCLARSYERDPGFHRVCLATWAPIESGSTRLRAFTGTDLLKIPRPGFHRTALLVRRTCPGFHRGWLATRTPAVPGSTRPGFHPVVFYRRLRLYRGQKMSGTPGLPGSKGCPGLAGLPARPRRGIGSPGGPVVPGSGVGDNRRSGLSPDPLF
jgi:hypothetical protein